MSSAPSADEKLFVCLKSGHSYTRRSLQNIFAMYWKCLCNSKL